MDDNISELKVIDMENEDEVLIAYLRNPAIYRKRKNVMTLRLRAADALERLLNNAGPSQVQTKPQKIPTHDRTTFGK